MRRATFFAVDFSAVSGRFSLHSCARRAHRLGWGYLDGELLG
ncbi:hypothetical protein OCEANICA350_11420 [Oceanicaulis sp. 350]|nr:hypothetical protein OCEANICA350_11420 [Oceanicaulis sp. 350]